MWVVNGESTLCSSECKLKWIPSICGDGKVWWEEECDYGKMNWDEGINCTNWCKYKEKCGNGKKDERENCKGCPEDFWDECRPLPPQPICWDEKADKWETCRNCPEDLKECVPTCWDGKVDKRETCRNCPDDLKTCPWSCGNGKIERPEQCDNGVNNGKDGKCSEDCVSLEWKCGNWVVEGTEECDAGKENGKYKWKNSCTIACTYFDDKDPKCGDGEEDVWENCWTCPIEFWNKCKWKCGDGEKWAGEECDNGEENGHDGKCTFECKIESDSKKYCGNWVVEREKWEECDMWVVNGESTLCSSECKLKWIPSICGDGKVWWEEECDYGEKNGDEGINCTNWCKYKEKCGNGKKDERENCKECPEDFWDECRPLVLQSECGNGKVEIQEECDLGEDNWKDWINCSIDCQYLDKCGNGKYDYPENCEWCPEDLLDLCVGPNPPVPPTPIEIIAEPDWWEINYNCNMCPCEYVDFSTDLAKWDILRANLWDQSLSVFYRYSNAVVLENFLDIK